VTLSSHKIDIGWLDLWRDRLNSRLRLLNARKYRFYDVAGSYGVNLLGYDFYKSCMEAGWERVRTLGPVLWAYHPVVAENVARLTACRSGQAYSWRYV
jgi:hypothetical protein